MSISWSNFQRFTLESLLFKHITKVYADVFVKLIFPGWHLEDSLQHEWEDKYPSVTKMTQASRVIHLINFNLSNLLT